MQKLRSQIAQFADSPFPVLIEGESGSGKELVANALHRLSSRARQAVPRAQLRRDLPDAGRADAVRLREGRLYRRDDQQVGLLRGRRRRHAVPRRDRRAAARAAGEAPARAGERRVPARRRDPEARLSHARVIAATNRDLRQEVQEGQLPRRPLPPARGVHDQRAAAARAWTRTSVLLLDHFRDFYAGQAKLAPFELDESATTRSGCDYASRATCASCATS